MAMCHRLRMLLLLLFLTWPVLQLDAAPTTNTNDVALSQIPKLSHAQVALIAGNATERCKFRTELCDWQLHLYEGHAFSVQLPQNSNNKNKNNKSVATTTTTTSLPPVESKPIPVIFAVPGHKLFIYAQVERRPNLAKTRQRKLLANFNKLL